MNMVLRSGTNQFHGNLNYYLRNDVLDARGFFEENKTVLRQHQFAATLAGPVIRNRTFFMISYEGLRAKQEAARLSRVVAALLALFRSGAELQREPIELTALLPRLPYEPLRLVLPPAAGLVADLDLLTAALINLLDNAVRQGARTLRLELRQEGELQILRLLDDGPGVSAPRRAELAAALAAQAYEGRMGLGLMLADLVARAHGGTLALPPVEAGFAVEMSFAAAAPRTRIHRPTCRRC